MTVPAEPLRPTPYDNLPKGHADWYLGGEFGENPESTAFDDLPTDIDHTIREVRRLLGDYRTLLFWRWADERGQRHGRSWRRQVYLPKSVDENHSLSRAIGFTAANDICQLFEGQTLDIPNINFTSRKQTQRYAVILNQRGLNAKEIAQEISLDYQVSAWTVRKWLKFSHDS